MKPILFSTAMVQAILDGRKTQTRRVVKGPVMMLDYVVATTVPCPYGQPVDTLWVRETWAHTLQLNINPEDENYGYVYKADGQPWEDYEGWRWKPSIHMPREAARLFLRIKSVRVERLQEISEDDACEEGIEIKTIPNADAGDYNCYPRNYMISEKDADGWPYFKEEQYIESFQSLWQSIKGPESWEANPFVWVVEFERITREEAGL